MTDFKPISSPFKNFENWIKKTLNTDNLPFKNIKHVFHIFNDLFDLKIEDKEERQTNLLILSASLYYALTKDKITFISPTYNYGVKAAMLAQKYFKDLQLPPHEIFPIVIPETEKFEQSILRSEVIFMHGGDFSSYLPANWSGRKIIQVFPNEDVKINLSIQKCFCNIAC